MLPAPREFFKISLFQNSKRPRRKNRNSRRKKKTNSNKGKTPRFYFLRSLIFQLLSISVKARPHEVNLYKSLSEVAIHVLSRSGQAQILRGVLARSSMTLSQSGQTRFVTTSADADYAEPAFQPSERKMEKSINQVTLLGRVGNDPQKRGSDEHPVVIFTLATHENFPVQGEMTQRTDWHRVCVFKPYLRESVSQYLTKGNRVLVQGRINYGEVKDENGNPRTTTSIFADDIIFMSSAK